jgi:hypothetical protein
MTTLNLRALITETTDFAVASLNIAFAHRPPMRRGVCAGCIRDWGPLWLGSSPIC